MTRKVALTVFLKFYLRTFYHPSLFVTWQTKTKRKSGLLSVFVIYSILEEICLKADFLHMYRVVEHLLCDRSLPADICKRSLGREKDAAKRRKTYPT